MTPDKHWTPYWCKMTAGRYAKCVSGTRGSIVRFEIEYDRDNKTWECSRDGTPLGGEKTLRAAKRRCRERDDSAAPTRH